MKLNEIKNEIDDICAKYGIQNYTINKDGSIDVTGNVDFTDTKITRLPLKFKNVTKSFSVAGCQNLESLEGAPISVGGDFYCARCPKLTSLEFAPTWVGEIFDCGGCRNLETLNGAPESVSEKFICVLCPKLTSLEFAPTWVGIDFDCSQCPKLTKLSHMQGIIQGKLVMVETPITNLLYLFKMKGTKKIQTEFSALDDIINKHLAGDRDTMECQEELIDSGFQEYARLK